MSCSIQATFEVMLLLSDFILNKLKNQKVLSVLDIASGRGKHGFLIKHYCLEAGGSSFIVGIDIWYPYLKYLKTTKVYDFLILSDATKLPFKSFLFDVVIVTEIIEHLRKKEGFALLNDCENLLKDEGIIVVSTPQGIQKQDIINRNIYQEHKSVWWKKDLEAIGYKVFVTPLVLRTPIGKKFLPIRSIHDIKHKNKIKNFILFLFSSLACLIPSLSGKIIAFKFGRVCEIDCRVNSSPGLNAVLSSLRSK